MYYWYICGKGHIVLEDGKVKEEMNEHIKTGHEDTFNRNNIHWDEGLVFCSLSLVRCS